MAKFLTSKQRLELRQAHRAESQQRFADRIKAILLLDAGWPVAKIVEALLIDPDTVRGYQQLYETGGLEHLCTFAYAGRPCQLSSTECEELKQELRSRIYLCTAEIVGFIETRFKVRYSLSGVTALLHRLGFSYKKPSLVPGKANAAEQQLFLKQLMNLKRRKNPADKL